MMFNPLLLPSADRDDRAFLAYVVVCLVLFGLNSFYDASINTSFDPNPDDAQGGLVGENITLTDTQPPTSWNKANPREYGFYSNVNPEVDHPRWSQATERRIGGGLFSARIPTLMFNGYAEEVAGLYAGMDLTKFH